MIADSGLTRVTSIAENTIVTAVAVRGLLKTTGSLRIRRYGLDTRPVLTFDERGARLRRSLASTGKACLGPIAPGRVVARNGIGFVWMSAHTGIAIVIGAQIALVDTGRTVGNRFATNADSAYSAGAFVPVIRASSSGQWNAGACAAHTLVGGTFIAIARTCLPRQRKSRTHSIETNIICALIAIGRAGSSIVLVYQNTYAILTFVVGTVAGITRTIGLRVHTFIRVRIRIRITVRVTIYVGVRVRVRISISIRRRYYTVAVQTDFAGRTVSAVLAFVTTRRHQRRNNEY
jgi:hypothetical protein